MANDAWLDSLDSWKTRAPEDDEEPGEPCPVCGDRTTAGDGPCSDECARILDERRPLPVRMSRPTSDGEPRDDER